jgi:hypothetical protein
MTTSSGQDIRKLGIGDLRGKGTSKTKKMPKKKVL